MDPPPDVLIPQDLIKKLFHDKPIDFLSITSRTVEEGWTDVTPFLDGKCHFAICTVRRDIAPSTQGRTIHLTQELVELVRFDLAKGRFSLIYRNGL